MLVLTTLLVLAAVVKVRCLSNGLAMTPPMGWDSWNMFGEQINETLVRQTMDAMEKFGLRNAGFVYINLDDGWQHYRANRTDKPLEADPVKFPSGIKALAEYAHSRGFKLGLYGAPGQTTCSGFTGSEGKEKEDAALYASWGVDHLKYDSCCSHMFATKAQVQKVILDMSTALMNQTHPIVYHACHCGWQDVWEWAAVEGANHWRIGQDISDDFNYPGLRDGYYYDVLDMIDRGNNITKYSGPGHWNDYDMLIVNLNGKSTQLVGTGASNTEYRTHFSLWCMVASPLLIGSDVRYMDNYTVETLTNKEMIAINQDPLGNAAVKVADAYNGTLQSYAKNISDGSIAVALINRGTETVIMGTMPLIKDWNLSWPTYRLRDLWQHKDFGTLNSTYWVEVMSHETKVYQMWQVK
ncbi:related to alpha-galactosidase precursor [Phialocephala subalpina]|uniref:Alpha-galactosidase n=1 Tax=Phialocephala subalpina TaxID=576137 RepID=A0A1L7X138_9HELO|nr:related to alpha-galactosidase precursor [Phialocephala subalpina]